MVSLVLYCKKCYHFQISEEAYTRNESEKKERSEKLQILSGALAECYNLDTIHTLIANIASVPQKFAVTCHDDYHPVALTLIILKCFEKQSSNISKTASLLIWTHIGLLYIDFNLTFNMILS